MGGILAGGSILAAFFGGAVALFSPCCIVFLLPAYLASAVKNRRWRLLPLTLLFALGLGVVLIPITLGIGLVASTLNRFHTGLYIAGGVLLAALAVLSFIGRSWSMPSSARAPDLASSDSAGVFSLGVFSGVASSCCAPVLAGVVTLSALASSPAGSFALGVAYVFGMTFPLFVMALAWDRFRLGDRRLFESRPLELRVAGRVVVTNTVNVVVAVAFALMSGLVFFLAATGETTSAPDAQLAIGRWLSEKLESLLRMLDPVPEPLLGLALVAVAGAFVVAALKPRRFEADSLEDADDVEEAQDQGTGADGSAAACCASGEDAERASLSAPPK